MIYNVAQVAVGGFFAGAAGELLKDSLTFPIDTVRTRLMTVGSFSEPPKPKASPTSGILYLYMHICINTHTHRSIYAYTYVHTHTYTHTRTHTHVVRQKMYANSRGRSGGRRRTLEDLLRIY